MRSELVALESSFAQQAAFNTNPIQSASVALTHLMKEMQDSQLVPPEHIRETQGLITRLLAGVHHIAEAATAQKQNAAAAAPPHAVAASAPADEDVGMVAEPDSESSPAARRTRIRDKVARSVTPYPPIPQPTDEEEGTA